MPDKRVQNTAIAWDKKGRLIYLKRLAGSETFPARRTSIRNGASASNGWRRRSPDSLVKGLILRDLAVNVILEKTHPIVLKKKVTTIY